MRVQRARACRSHHCTDIGMCVDRMDHFRPWIDNAVGAGNHRLFVVFLTVLWCATLAIREPSGLCS